MELELLELKYRNRSTHYDDENDSDSMLEAIVSRIHDIVGMILEGSRLNELDEVNKLMLM
ncbi:hypothetical protein DPMN_038415 [Dreissena polymorpha]|uniref:Uncharacterized protein n=1 Tax=Dreissena polymorpha TaxID=45954 RepID=A0A9D4MCP3_DREPO|nr:hypothetical protein DPMN_038415 [Dreissena polymorpha]